MAVSVQSILLLICEILFIILPMPFSEAGGKKKRSAGKKASEVRRSSHKHNIALSGGRTHPQGQALAAEVAI